MEKKSKSDRKRGLFFHYRPSDLLCALQWTGNDSIGGNALSVPPLCYVYLASSCRLQVCFIIGRDHPEVKHTFPVHGLQRPFRCYNLLKWSFQVLAYHLRYIIAESQTATNICQLFKEFIEVNILIGLKLLQR